MIVFVIEVRELSELTNKNVLARKKRTKSRFLRNPKTASDWFTALKIDSAEMSR